MKGSDRITIIDKIMKEQKKYPAPNTYSIHGKSTPLLGKLNKTQGISFMSESEFLGVAQPAPNKYEINESLVKKKLVGFKMIKPKLKYQWKPVKVKGPDSGTYNYPISLENTSRMKKVTNTIFNKTKRPHLHKSSSKNKTPGVGSYKLDKVFDKIYRPMKTSRH